MANKMRIKYRLRKLKTMKFLYNLSFENCKFECEIFLRHKAFNRALRFKRCIFEKFVNFNFSDSRINFNSGFICQDTIFEDIAYFIKINFNGKVDFSRSRFKERAFFSESTFEQKANFAEVIFDNNAYFDDVKFKKEAFFKQAEFYKNAHFYGTDFEEFPNFIQVIFNEDINFTNTDFIIDFDATRGKINRTYDDRKKENNEEEPKKHKIANEFRDSFRNIKSALIEHHSMLDASNYHRVELYCKELELEYKREEKAKTFWKKFKFILSNGKDFVDEIQLKLYRLTSDHHTNLLLILNNVLILIAAFGIANLFLDALNQNGEVLICIAFLIISIPLMMCRTTFTTQKGFRRCLIIIKHRKNKIPLLLTCLLRCCAVVVAYGMTIYMIFTTPSSILPILGKLIENKSAEICLFVVGNVKLLCCGGNSFASETLNLIYMLFLFLLLWSLQKTARKNTIVPS